MRGGITPLKFYPARLPGALPGKIPERIRKTSKARRFSGYFPWFLTGRIPTDRAMLFGEAWLSQSGFEEENHGNKRPRRIPVSASARGAAIFDPENETAKRPSNARVPASRSS
jgi:hypothetical protein